MNKHDTMLIHYIIWRKDLGTSTFPVQGLVAGERRGEDGDAALAPKLPFAIPAPPL
jgi:hypothetical protein